MASIRKRAWTSGGETKTAWIADYVDQAGKRHIKTFRTKTEARDWLPKTEVDVKQRVHIPESTAPTVGSAAEAWIRRGEVDQRERSTLEQRRQHVEFHILPLLGSDIKLSKIDVDAFRDELLRTRSRALAKKVMTSLKAILRQAKMAHLAANVERIETGGRHKRRLEVGRDIPTKEEINAMLGAADGYIRPLLTVLVFCGLRMSEVRALRWQDISFDERLVHVRQRADKWGSVGSLKSETSYRSIPMAPPVENALKAWRGDRIFPGEALVFGNRRGNVESLPNIWNRHLAPLQRTAGVVDRDGRAKYGAHSLRHFFASWLIERGFNVKQVSSWLGHSSPVVTLSVYAHLLPTENVHERFAAGAAELVG